MHWIGLQRGAITQKTRCIRPRFPLSTSSAQPLKKRKSSYRRRPSRKAGQGRHRQTQAALIYVELVLRCNGRKTFRRDIALSETRTSEAQVSLRYRELTKQWNASSRLAASSRGKRTSCARVDFSATCCRKTERGANRAASLSTVRGAG